MTYVSHMIIIIIIMLRVNTQESADDAVWQPVSPFASLHFSYAAAASPYETVSMFRGETL